MLEKLAKEFDKNTILFIGSGASVSANLPSWGKLIEWLIEYTASLGGKTSLAIKFRNDNNFLEAASALTSELNKVNKSISDFFKEDENCKIFKTAKPQEIHKLIAQLPSSSVITTNYDLLIEKAFKSTDYPLQVIHKSETNSLNSIKRNKINSYLYKYHGCITKPDTIVLDHNHYNLEINGQSEDAECLKCLIQTKTFVFIGTGLEDPDFKQIWNYLTLINKASSIEFWAFMRNCELETEYYKQQYGVNLISYSGEGNDHSDLLNKIEELLVKIRILGKQKERAANLIDPISKKNAYQDGLLRSILVQVNKNIIPLDEQILGFVSFFDTIEKKSCYRYLSDYKGIDAKEITNRIDYLTNKDLLKQTDNFLLPVKGKHSEEAAKIVEDDILEYLMVNNHD